MRKILLVIASVLSLAGFSAAPATAGLSGAHFVGTPQVSVSGSTVSVSAKEAGLGDVAQIHVVLTATAECINGGGHHPHAANKTSVTASADEPVQNGRADYTISGVAAFSPSCSPPMTVEFTDITLTDTTTGLTFP